MKTCLFFIQQAFGCIDQDRDGVIKKQDLKETYAQLGILFTFKSLLKIKMFYLCYYLLINLPFALHLLLYICLNWLCVHLLVCVCLRIRKT